MSDGYKKDCPLGEFKPIVPETVDGLETPYDPLTPVRAEIGTLALQLSASGRKIEDEVAALARQRDELLEAAKVVLEYPLVCSGFSEMCGHCRLRSAVEEASK